MHVTGTTTSPDFPVTGSSPRHQNAIDFDAFVAKWSDTGELIASTVVRSAGSEEGWRVNVDNASRAWIGTLNGTASLIVIAPGPDTSSARVRVTAVGDSSGWDINDADIRVSAAKIHVVLPVANTIVRRGQMFRIFFTHNLGAPALVAIDVSTEGGHRWTTLVTRHITGSTTSSYKWTIGTGATNRAQVRVRALDACTPDSATRSRDAECGSLDGNAESRAVASGLLLDSLSPPAYVPTRI